MKSALLEITPLADVAENMDDNLWLIGNRNLLSLNLSSKNENKIITSKEMVQIILIYYSIKETI